MTAAANPIPGEQRAEQLHALAEQGAPFGAVGHLLDPALVRDDPQRACRDYEQARYYLTVLDGLDSKYAPQDVHPDCGTTECAAEHLHGWVDELLLPLIYGLCAACTRDGVPLSARGPARPPLGYCHLHEDMGAFDVMRAVRVPLVLTGGADDPWQVES